MDSFFDGMDAQVAGDMAAVSRHMYDLREARKRVLAEFACENADAMIAAVHDGRLPEHPGYDGWLAARLMQEQEAALQEELQWRCRRATGQREPPPSRAGLAGLAAKLERALPPTFASGMQRHHDGLAFHGTDGVDVLVRIATPGEWSFEWRWMGALWRLDTAPVAHPGIVTRAHLHRPDGTVVDDPMPLPYTESAVAIVRGFLYAVAQSPTLGLD